VDLFGRHGLCITDLEENDVNGGSYRLYVRHKEAGGPKDRSGLGRVMDAWRVEEAMRLDDPATYATLFARMQANRDRLVEFVKREWMRGKRVHVRGASTKGNVILQHAGLDKTLIEAASDRSEEKWGRVTAGGGIPIVPPEQSRAAGPDVYLVLPYAFRREIVEEEREFLDRGGRLAFPLPEFGVVGKEGVVDV
jgi:NDP-4-keto-2,6-dideoxyhexose 3-C-methyltransferase